MVEHTVATTTESGEAIPTVLLDGVETPLW
jgi:hypothetical protein